MLVETKNMDGHVLEAELPEGSGGHSRGLGAGSVKPDHLLFCTVAGGPRLSSWERGPLTPTPATADGDLAALRSCAPGGGGAPSEPRGQSAEPVLPAPRPDLPVSAGAWNRVGAREMLKCWVRERESE